MAGRSSSDADASAGEASADGAGGAVPKHVGGSAAGREVAGVEDDDLVGERGDFGRLVRDVENRQGEGRLDLQEVLEDPLFERTVEAGEGLVEKQDLRCRQKGPAQGDAAPLSAGKRRGPSVE